MGAAEKSGRQKICQSALALQHTTKTMTFVIELHAKTGELQIMDEEMTGIPSQ